jgi:ankyrin repeat protein
MKRGADYHVDDEYPLRKALKNGHIELAKEFLRRGANPNANNYELLIWAIENRKLDILDLLLSHGGEAGFFDKKYIKKAKEAKDYELKNLLESYLN